MNIHLEFAFTVEDSYEFHLAHRKVAASLRPRGARRSFLQSPFAWLAIALLAVLIFVFGYFGAPATAPAKPPISDGLIGVVPWILFFLLLWWFLLRGRFFKAIYRRAFVTNPKLAEFQQVDLGDDQITVRRPGLISTMEWSRFIHFHESPNLFVLFTVNRTGNILPKRAFTSPADIETFRAFAQAHVRN